MTSFTSTCCGFINRCDHVFASLLAIEWLAGIAVAIWISPLTWSGLISQTHVHVWAAIFLGGLIVTLPIVLATIHPGSVITRHFIAAGQMLMGALLIHLTGGRIETHFHVFCTGGTLAAYRDYRVLLTASAIVAADHFLREVFWPHSIFGVAVVSHWQQPEHVGWVIFEDVFLVRVSLQGINELRENHVE